MWFMIQLFDDITTSKPEKSFKCCNSENDDDIKYALSGMMGNQPEFHLSNLLDSRIGQQIFTHLILKFCKHCTSLQEMMKFY